MSLGLSWTEFQTLKVIKCRCCMLSGRHKKKTQVIKPQWTLFLFHGLCKSAGRPRTVPLPFGPRPFGLSIGVSLHKCYFYGHYCVTCVLYQIYDSVSWE